jgi:transposase
MLKRSSSKLPSSELLHWRRKWATDTRREKRRLPAFTQGRALTPTCPDALADLLKAHQDRLERVGLEAGPMSEWLVRGLAARGVGAVLMERRQAHKALSAMTVKTDRNDARGLAHLLRMGWFRPVHVKTVSAREQRARLAARETLVRQSRDLENGVRGLLRGFGLRVPPSLRARWSDAVRALVEGHPSLPGIVEPLLRAREALCGELAALDRQVRDAGRDDAVCRRLMTLPGVGAVVALTFRSAIDDPARFRSSRSVGAFLGLTPKRYQSGETDRAWAISKVGDAAVRVVELQLQAAVEIDPKGPVVRFTRRVFHGAATDDAASCWESEQVSLLRASRMPAIREIQAYTPDGPFGYHAAHRWEPDSFGRCAASHERRYPYRPPDSPAGSAAVAPEGTAAGQGGNADWGRSVKMTVRTPAVGITQASGDPIAHAVAPLTAHHATGMGSSTQRARAAARSRTPSVATTVGSGAMPKTSTCDQVRPTRGPISGWTTSAKTYTPAPMRPAQRASGREENRPTVPTRARSSASAAKAAAT